MPAALREREFDAAAILGGKSAANKPAVNEFSDDNGDGALMRMGAVGQFVDGNRLVVAEFLENEYLRAAESEASFGLVVESAQDADDAAEGVEDHLDDRV